MKHISHASQIKTRKTKWDDGVAPGVNEADKLENVKYMEPWMLHKSPTITVTLPMLIDGIG